MRSVFKYPLAIVNEQTIDIPGGFAEYKPLFVAEQNETLCLWCECSPNLDKEPVVVYIYGTGEEIDGGDVYVGSVLMHGGSAVWHVYV